MADVKLTKQELRQQQHRLAQLEKYLPTLQLKKAMLQVEVNDARIEIAALHERYRELQLIMENYEALPLDSVESELRHALTVVSVKKRFENVAGIVVPYFESVTFEDHSYSLFDTPPWLDCVIAKKREAAEVLVEIDVVKEKKSALEEELRQVSIRVNLFEKCLIPRALTNIKKIKVFLGDQQLAAVSQAKAAKTKINRRKAMQTVVY